MAQRETIDRHDLNALCATYYSLSTLYLLRHGTETLGVFTLEDAIRLARLSKRELCDYGHVSATLSSNMRHALRPQRADTAISLPVLFLQRASAASLEHLIPFPLHGPPPVSTPSKTMVWNSRIQKRDLWRKFAQVARWLRQDRIVELRVRFFDSRRERIYTHDAQRAALIMQQRLDLLRFGVVLEAPHSPYRMKVSYKILLLPIQRVYVSPFLEDQRRLLLAVLMARQRDKAAELNAWLSDGEGVLFL